VKLVFAPMYNTGDKRDATGAFHPEARAFCQAHGESAPVKLFDNGRPMAARFSEVMAWIDSCNPSSVDTLAAFCHGFKSGLQIGATIANAPRLADALQRVFAPSPRIIMYACDAARDADSDRTDEDDPGPGGEGGFADKLRDELVKRGVMATIYAHSTAAHTTQNPFVRRFDPSDLAGGRWVVEPYSADWQRWRTALRGSMRFRFPFMSQAEIEAEIRAAPGVA